MLVIQNIISKKNTNHQDNIAPFIINNFTSIAVQQVISWVKNMIILYDKECSIYK